MRSVILALFFLYTGAVQPSVAAELLAIENHVVRIEAAAISDGLTIVLESEEASPVTTHVIARFQNNRPLMLGTDGKWATWNGLLKNLDDAGANVKYGKMYFQIFDQRPPDLFYPVSFTVAYRTNQKLHSGTIVVHGP